MQNAYRVELYHANRLIKSAITNSEDEGYSILRTWEDEAWRKNGWNFVNLSGQLLENETVICAFSH